MSEGLGVAGANAALDAVQANFPWIKLHIGAPGITGTSNAAVETTREQVTWAVAASGVGTSSAQVQWTNVAGTEQYTKASFWSASSGGSFGFSGSITANSVSAGDTFTIASGDIDTGLTLAS